MLSALCLTIAAPTRAQTLVGQWQATAGDRKGVFKFARGPDGRIHGEAYFPGQEFSGNTLNGNPVSVEVHGRDVRVQFDEQDVTFEGSLSADGNSLVGTSTAQGWPLPLKFERATSRTAWVIDPSPHKVLFVPVEPGVRLEVLDWGGHGPPLILLPGNGDTAHVFDAFALNFTGKHHVYGITRRGFGQSSKPLPTDANYDADRLGDDVLAVIDALKLDRPVLAGHSLGGEELSSVGTRHPERVSGLIYLDASYDYAFYSPGGDSLDTDVSTLRRDLLSMFGSATPSQTKALIQEMQATIPRLQGDLQKTSATLEGQRDPPGPLHESLRDRIEAHIFTGTRRYGPARAPVLAIVAHPHACGANCDSPQNKAQDATVAAQTDAFEAANPSARVVRIPHAQHYVFLSNEADVVREMNAFMDTLH
jgi:pimeloyl-ACP methyl ester carboxylesterase